MATALSTKDVQAFREILLGLRSRLRSDLDRMTDEALHQGAGEAAGALSTLPSHLADIGTESYDQDFALGLIENEQETLQQIDEALQRIEDGTFGVCQECGQPIAKPRLLAIPYASTCINCARKAETQG